MIKIKSIYKTVLFFGLISLMSCSPEEGDIYENKLTRERVQVQDVNVCSLFVESYKIINSDIVEIAMEEGSSIDEIEPMLFKVEINFSDDSEECVEISSDPGSNYSELISIDRFNNNYSKVK